MSGRQNPSRGLVAVRPDIPDRLSIWAIWLLLAGGVLREVLGQTEIANFGLYTFHAVDAGTAVGFLAALANLSQGRLSRRPIAVPILLMTALILFNFIRGLSGDVAPALLWIRANGGIVSFLLLAITVRPLPSVFRATRKALLLAALLLCGLTLLRLATHPTLFMTFDVSDFEVNDGGRPLTAQGAFLLVIASAMLTSEVLFRARILIDRHALFAATLPILILLTRQGTANIAEFCVLATVVFLQRGRLQSARILLGAIAIIGVFGILAIYLPALMQSEDVVRRTGTFDARKEIWDSLLSIWPTLPLTTQMIGFPADQKPNLLVFLSGDYRYWDFSIHSMYLGSLPMMGYAGAISYITMLAILCQLSFKTVVTELHPLSAAPFALCVATMILSYTYEMRDAALFGLFLAICILRRRMPQPAVGPFRGRNQIPVQLLARRAHRITNGNQI